MSDHVLDHKEECQQTDNVVNSVCVPISSCLYVETYIDAVFLADIFTVWICEQCSKVVWKVFFLEAVQAVLVLSPFSLVFAGF